jgi:hypothetical protein
MKLDDLLLSDNEFSAIDVIKENCSQFIYQSNGVPLLKNLPRTYNDFHKVKVRKRKGDKINTPFNEAFDYHHLRQRAIFANGLSSLEESDQNDIAFYIFPIDGYRFLYHKNVQNSNTEYQKSFDTILESLGDNKGASVIADMLQFSYVDNMDLSEGIESGAEIIIYNIPYFYSIKELSLNNYESFYSTLL